MSAKEQLLSVLDFINETEAAQILDYVNRTLSLNSKTWDDIEENDPTPDEIAALEEYRSVKL
jgi:hypothetical protein